MYQITIVFVGPTGAFIRDIEYYSDSVPDLCAVAETLTPAYEITVYTGNPMEMWIMEEHDVPGDKGNYGGIWMRHPVVLPPNVPV
jgi:hypothetical protein